MVENTLGMGLDLYKTYIFTIRITNKNKCDNYFVRVYDQ